LWDYQKYNGSMSVRPKKAKVDGTAIVLGDRRKDSGNITPFAGKHFLWVNQYRNGLAKNNSNAYH
jgi:hypothetical protein